MLWGAIASFIAAAALMPVLVALGFAHAARIPADARLMAQEGGSRKLTLTKLRSTESRHTAGASALQLG